MTMVKAWVAGLLALGTWGTTAFADGDLTAVEWFGLIGVPVAFLGVYQASNRP